MTLQTTTPAPDTEPTHEHDHGHEHDTPATPLQPVRPPAIDAARRAASTNNKLSNLPPVADIKERLNATQTQDHGGGYVSSQHNASGEDVKFWQEQFKSWAIAQGGETAARYQNMSVTDSFATNPQFTDLIKEYQAANGLRVDGIIGPRTFRSFAMKYFDASYGVGSFETYTGVKLLEEAAYAALIAQSEMRSRRSYAENLPLPKAVDAKTILADPKKLQGFRDVMAKYAKGGASALPVSPERFLEICAEKNFDPSLALAQAICESNIGTSGGRPTDTKNMHNVGNVNSGANVYRSSWEAGVAAYCDFMIEGYGNIAENVIDRNFQRINKRGYYAVLDNMQPNYKYFNDVERIVGEIRRAVGAEERYESTGSFTFNGQGTGAVKFEEAQDIPRMSPELIAALNQAASELGFKEIFVTCAITGHGKNTKSGNPSRHMQGIAVDIGAIDGKRCNTNDPQGAAKADALVAWLQTKGFVHTTSESGNDRAVIWRSDGHYNHIHASLRS